jgi:molecular chaperone DnaK
MDGGGGQPDFGDLGDIFETIFGSAFGGGQARNNADSLVHATERQLEENGDKIDAALKSDVEAAIAATKTAIESGDAAEMTAKTQALTDLAMKMGQAIYEKEQAAAAAPGGDASSTAGSEAGGEDVVDAEFSEVDENKG